MDLFNRKKLKELKAEHNELLAKYFKTQNQLDWLKDAYFKLQKENTELKQLNQQKKCKFIQEGDDMDNNYMCTGCGEVWCFEENTPVEVDCNYCSKCGAKITEVIKPLKEDE